MWHVDEMAARLVALKGMADVWVALATGENVGERGTTSFEGYLNAALGQLQPRVRVGEVPEVERIGYAAALSLYEACAIQLFNLVEESATRAVLPEVRRLVCPSARPIPARSASL